MNRPFRKSWGALALLAGFAGGAFADWTPQVSVADVQVSGANTDGSRVYVMVSPPIASSSCTAPNAATQWRIDGSNQRGKYQIALINVAMAMGKKITVSIQQCDDWGYPVVYDLQLFNN